MDNLAFQGYRRKGLATGINCDRLLSQFLFSKLNESIASLEARHLSYLQSLEAADLGKSHSQALLWPPPLPTKV